MMSRNHCNWMLILVVILLNSIGDCNGKIEKITEKDPRDGGLSKSYHEPQMSRATEVQGMKTNMNQYNQHNSMGKDGSLKNVVDMKDPVKKGVNDKKKEEKKINKLGLQRKKEGEQEEANKTSDDNVGNECFLKCCCENKPSPSKNSKSLHLRAKRMDPHWPSVPPCKECGLWPVNGKCSRFCRLYGTHTGGNSFHSHEPLNDSERMPPPPPRLPAQPTAARDKSKCDCGNTISSGYYCPTCKYDPDTGEYYQTDAGASSSSAARDKNKCDCGNIIRSGYFCPTCKYDPDTGGYIQSDAGASSSTAGGSHHTNPPSSDTNTNFGQVYLPLLGGGDRECYCGKTISYGFYCPDCFFYNTGH